MLLLAACYSASEMRAWTAEPPQASPSEAPPAPAFTAPDSTNSSRTVVSEGVGVDVEAAKSDAYRNAVRQAVGAYVDASTIVANDRLITDEIISLSGAFISKVEIVPDSITKDGPFTRVRVKAQVETGKVLTALQKRKVATVSDVLPVDTESLLAEIATQEDRLAGTEKLLRKLFEGYPQKCFRASIVGQPQAKKIDPAKPEAPDIELLCRVRIEADLEMWAEFSRALTEILKVIALEHSTTKTTPKPDTYWKGNAREQFANGFFDPNTTKVHKTIFQADAQWIGARHWGEKPRKVPREHCDIAVMTGGLDGEADFHWESFTVPQRIASCLPKTWRLADRGTVGSFCASRFSFAILNEPAQGEPIRIQQGACQRAGLCGYSASHKPSWCITPCLILMGVDGVDKECIGFACGVEFTTQAFVFRTDVAKGLHLRCALE